MKDAVRAKMKHKNMKNDNKALTIIICSLLLMIIFLGCSEQKKEPIERVTKKEVVKPQVEEVKALTVHSPYNEETYGDPEIFSEPRLQFTWRAPLEDEYTIWSSTLDGSDLRRVVAPELLFKYDGVLMHLPVRSPDNRYLAVCMDTREYMGTAKLLFDLKEKTVTELGGGSYVPHFAWTSDSKTLYYYNGKGFWQYKIESKKKKLLPTLYSRGLYILDDDRFVTLHSWGYSVHSKDRKEIFRKEIPGGCVSSSTQAVSIDGTFIFCGVACNKKPFDILFKLNDPEDILLKSSDYLISYPAFGPHNKKIYFTQGVVRTLDLETKEIKRIFSLPDRPISDLTIINLKS